MAVGWPAGDKIQLAHDKRRAGQTTLDGMNDQSPVSGSDEEEDAKDENNGRNLKAFCQLKWCEYDRFVHSHYISIIGIWWHLVIITPLAILFIFTLGAYTLDRIPALLQRSSGQTRVEESSLDYSEVDSQPHPE